MKSSTLGMKGKKGFKKKVSISELYALLVLKHGLSPKYVLDEMEWYEVNAILKYGYYSIKDNWEQARLIAYMIAQVNSKHRLKMQDIVPFSWEEEYEEHEEEVMTKEKMEHLKQEAQNYLLQKNNVEKRS